MLLNVQQPGDGYYRVSFNNPPLNLLNYELSDAISSEMDRLEANPSTRVVVFTSEVPDYFMGHFDLADPPPAQAKLGKTGLPDWIDLGQRFHQAPFVTIGMVRGRARGVGSEFLQMLDMRFASREKAIFGHPEVGCGIVPGGGGLERLPALVGRARALEIVLGSQDFDASTAERYGWINRALPDADLDAYVDELARRIASFSQPAAILAKSIINQRTPAPSAEDQLTTQERFFGLVASAQPRIQELFARGLQTDGDLERNLGTRLGPQSAPGA